MPVISEQSTAQALQADGFYVTSRKRRVWRGWVCFASINPLKRNGNYMSHLLQQSKLFILYSWFSYDSHCKQGLFP
jgi:hypothetical protein